MNIHGYCRHFRLLTCNSFIGQFVHPVEWEGMEALLFYPFACFTSLENNENLVQAPSNNTSIIMVPKILKTHSH